MGATMTFDTLALAQRLREKGFDQEKAEAIVGVVRDAQAGLFTKEDAELMEARINSRISAIDAKFSEKISETKVQLIFAVLTIVGFANAILFFALKH